MMIVTFCTPAPHATPLRTRSVITASIPTALFMMFTPTRKVRDMDSSFARVNHDQMSDHPRMIQRTRGCGRVVGSVAAVLKDTGLVRGEGKILGLSAVQFPCPHPVVDDLDTVAEERLVHHPQAHGIPAAYYQQLRIVQVVLRRTANGAAAGDQQGEVDRHRCGPW